MEGDVEGLEDLKFQGLFLIEKSILTKRRQEILFILVFQVVNFEVVGEGGRWGGGGYIW